MFEADEQIPPTDEQVRKINESLDESSGYKTKVWFCMDEFFPRCLPFYQLVIESSYECTNMFCEWSLGFKETEEASKVSCRVFFDVGKRVRLTRGQCRECGREVAETRVLKNAGLYLILESNANCRERAEPMTAGMSIFQGRKCQIAGFVYRVGDTVKTIRAEEIDGSYDIIYFIIFELYLNEYP